MAFLPRKIVPKVDDHIRSLIQADFANQDLRRRLRLMDPDNAPARPKRARDDDESERPLQRPRTEDNRSRLEIGQSAGEFGVGSFLVTPEDAARLQETRILRLRRQLALREQQLRELMATPVAGQAAGGDDEEEEDDETDDEDVPTAPQSQSSQERRSAVRRMTRTPLAQELALQRSAELDRRQRTIQEATDVEIGPPTPPRGVIVSDTPLNTDALDTQIDAIEVQIALLQRQRDTTAARRDAIHAALGPVRTSAFLRMTASELQEEADEAEALRLQALEDADGPADFQAAINAARRVLSADADQQLITQARQLVRRQRGDDDEGPAAPIRAQAATRRATAAEFASLVERVVRELSAPIDVAAEQALLAFPQTTTITRRWARERMIPLVAGPIPGASAADIAQYNDTARTLMERFTWDSLDPPEEELQAAATSWMERWLPDLVPVFDRNANSIIELPREESDIARRVLLDASIDSAREARSRVRAVQSIMEEYRNSIGSEAQFDVEATIQEANAEVALYTMEIIREGLLMMLNQVRQDTMQM